MTETKIYCDYCGKAEVAVKGLWFSSYLEDFPDSRTKLYLCSKCAKKWREFTNGYLKYSEKYKDIGGKKNESLVNS